MMTESCSQGQAVALGYVLPVVLEDSHHYHITLMNLLHQILCIHLHQASDMPARYRTCWVQIIERVFVKLFFSPFRFHT